MCILTLDGHSQQGCEAYAVLMSAKNGRGGADFGDAGVAWNSYGWAVVQVEPEPDEAGMSMPDSFTFTLSPRMSSIEAMFSHFFQTFQARVHPSEPLRKGHNPRFASRRCIPADLNSGITLLSAAPPFGSSRFTWGFRPCGSSRAEPG